ncbi:helix-turn-helix transcriptional regulator [Brucellaceae bacterium C25G]
MTGPDLDLTDLSRKFDSRENNLPSFSPDVRQDTVLLKGSFSYQRLRSGFTLHTSDVTEVYDLEARTEVKPGLTFLYFSHGEVDARFGERKFHFSGGDNTADTPKAFIVNRLEPELFLRQTRTGRHIRKMVITVSPEWLDVDGLAGIDQPHTIRNFLCEHLACARVKPTAKLQTLFENIIHQPAGPKSILKLQMESKAIDVVAEMLTLISEPETGSVRLTIPQQKLLKAAINFIDENLESIHSVYDVSDYLKTSPSSLQRLFRKALGCSVFDHIRVKRMKRALTALQTSSIHIAQAAYIAGYTNPANFATAFKKTFGISPTEARRYSV